ncbi:MAG: hypothetical protein Q4B68_06215 [Bacteroidales bacterium]|nr:hypothetical protein [Bacteroidales bacterium]
MRRFLFTVMILATAAMGFAKEGEVILTRYYTQAESHILPSKTDQFQVQNLVLNADEQTAPIVDAINRMLSIINDEDYEHYVFSLFVYPESDGNYNIQIEAHDPMHDPKPVRDNMMGVAKIGYRYFIVHKMPAIEQLQKALFKKAKGKTRFVREFELVTVARKTTRTSVAASLRDGALHFTEIEISNVNKLETPTDGVMEELDYNQNK